MVIHISVQLQKLFYDNTTMKKLVVSMCCVLPRKCAGSLQFWLNPVLTLALNEMLARLPWNGGHSNKTSSSTQISTAICVCFQQ